MRVAICLYGDTRMSMIAVDALKVPDNSVDVYVHIKVADPYPTRPVRCCWVEEYRRVSGPEGVSEEQMWVYWSMARLGKMVIQTEQKEGRYALVAFVSPGILTGGLPGNLLDDKVHSLRVRPDRMAIGPSTDMQLYLNKISQLQTYVERLPEGFKDENFAAWCLNGQSDKRATNWLEDL